MNRTYTNKHTVYMKKALFLAVSLLSISTVFCFAGCDRNGNGETVKDNQARIIAVEDEDNAIEEKPEEICPDCGKRGMPKVHFEFKNGRPAGKRDRDNGEDGAPLHDKHHARHGHRHGKHKPAPPEIGNENG